ncbi:STN domain-containing protein [Nitrosomonas europaea]|uniref:STN domain-containing protein n=1 Tax=Nitrosomonas europaea TaxID=915 RepID=UPI0032651D9F
MHTRNRQHPHRRTRQVPRIRSYNIPVGPLNTVLIRFLSESGLLLSGSTELAQGRNSPGVQGRFTPGAALNALLTGTGLDAVPDARGKYVLQEASVVSTLPSLQVTSTPLVLQPYIFYSGGENPLRR